MIEPPCKRGYHCLAHLKDCKKQNHQFLPQVSLRWYLSPPLSQKTIQSKTTLHSINPFLQASPPSRTSESNHQLMKLSTGHKKKQAIHKTIEHFKTLKP